jgi:hypothetical protein
MRCEGAEMPAAVVDMMAGLGCTAGSLGKDGLGSNDAGGVGALVLGISASWAHGGVS